MLKSFYEQLDLVSRLSVLVAFNANIDSIKHLTKHEIQRIIDSLNKERIKKLIKKKIISIHSKEEFIALLLKSMNEGKPREVPLGDLSMEKWFDNFVGIGYEQIGGQAGIVADLLSTIGIGKVIFYTKPISKKLLDKMETRNMFFPIVENNTLKLEKIDKIGIKNTKTKINRIFEYQKNTEVYIENIVIRAKNSSRLIVASRPDEVRIGFDEKLSKHIGELSKIVDGFFVSGFHSIKKKYDDGLDFEYYIYKNREDLKKMRKCNKKLRIHLEMAALPDEKMRKYMIENIFPVVDYVGMDNGELNDITSVLFNYKVDERDLEDVIKNLTDIMRIFNLKGIQLHTFEYLMLITRDTIDSSEIKNALNFGSVMASTRAALGKISSKSDLITGLKVPFTIEGLKLQKQLGKIKNKYDFSIELMPTRMVYNPKATVGLGDTLSAGIFISLLSSLKNVKN